eukprot:TRINITY_DN22783_c0_g1_i3.p1 TRINITY_DN22783_c0_g1~~TRINITY_DN22783_c0_g1_i3.p1  ORF type:complete len:747 (+),score=259.81 TRINITY_DN22783_c0_g1_i3:2380-4620(+)
MKTISPKKGGTPPPQLLRVPSKVEDSAEVRYALLTRQLQEVSTEKASSGSAGKRASALLEEIVCFERYANPELTSILEALMKFEKITMHELLCVLMWRALTQGLIEPHRFDMLVRSACQLTESDAPEVRRTGFTVILMLNLLQQKHSDLALKLPHSFMQGIITSLKKALEFKISEKRGFASKSSWHESKRIRLQAHLAALGMFNKMFITHMYPVLSSGQVSVSTVSQMLMDTTIEYSYKTKDVPIVRECLNCLCQMAEVLPESVQCVVEYLPYDMKQIHAQHPTKKDKKGKEKPLLPCWDVVAVSSLAKLCLTVLSKQGKDAATKSPFMTCLYQLFHYPQPLVFTDVVFGIVKRSGMFYILMQPDQVYGSKELLFDYSLNRIQNMITGNDQIQHSVGLKLIIAISEQFLVQVGSRQSELNECLVTLCGLSTPVAACMEKFSYDPHVCFHSLKAQIWLAAVAMQQSGSASDCVGKPVKVRALLHNLIQAANESPLNSDHKSDLLRTLVRAMKILPHTERLLLIPAFTGFVQYLTHRCIHKVSIHGFYGILQEFLMNVDVTQPKGDPVKAPLDVDSVPYQRANGGSETLRLVLDILDGVMNQDVVAAEELAHRTVDPGADRHAKYSKLVIEVARFTGDYGNVLVNDKGDCYSKMLLLLTRLEALLYTQPHHIVWEAGLAVLKIASRSLPCIRVKAYSILTSAVELREELHSLLAPLIDIIDRLMELINAFNYTQTDDGGGIGMPSQAS